MQQKGQSPLISLGELMVHALVLKGPRHVLSHFIASISPELLHLQHFGESQLGTGSMRIEASGHFDTFC